MSNTSKEDFDQHAARVQRSDARRSARTTWFIHPKCNECGEISPEGSDECKHCGADL